MTLHAWDELPAARDRRRGLAHASTRRGRSTDYDGLLQPRAASSSTSSACSIRTRCGGRRDGLATLIRWHALQAGPAADPERSIESLPRRARGDPRRWLVTGVAGFIGSHLVESLLSLDQKVVGLDNFATGHRGTWTRSGARSLRRNARAAPLRRRRHPRPGRVPGGVLLASTSFCTRRRWARCRARSRTRSPPTPPTSTVSSTCSSPRATPASCASSTRHRVRPTATIRRCPRSRTHRPAAVAVRGHQVRQRTLRRRLRALLRPADGRPALLQRLRRAPGPGGRLRGGDPALGSGTAERRAGLHQRRRRDQPRLLLRRQRGAGEPAGGDDRRAARPSIRSTTSRSTTGRR